MNPCARILLLILMAPLCAISQKQFQLKLPKSNLVIQRVDSLNSWRFITDINAKEVGIVESDYCFVRICENQLWVYSSTKNKWLNTSISKTNSPVISKEIPYYKDLHHSYHSYWFQANKGHVIIQQPKDRFEHNSRQYNQNSEQPILYLGGNVKLKISEAHTQFAIIEKNAIFQIDTVTHIWRTISANKSMSAWSNEPPTYKYLNGYFNDFPAGIISYIGRKDQQFLYQISKGGKVGLVKVDTTLNSFTTISPPKYDFITPSVHWDGYFVIQNNEVQLTNASFSFHEPLGELSTTPFTVSPPNSNRTIEISQLDGGNILYNDYAEDFSDPSSGVYSMEQQVWFMAPTHYKLMAFPNSVVEILPENQGEKTYSLYSQNGFSFFEKVMPNTEIFHDFVSTLVNVETKSIKELNLLSKNNSTQVTFRVKKIWHTVNLEKGEISAKQVTK